MSADRKRERGAALAELVVVVPVMLTMLLVVFDFGRGFHAYISVTNGARHAARVAMHDDKGCNKADLAAIAQNGSSPYNVAVSDPVEKDGLCYVTVSYDYTPVIPFVTTSFQFPGMPEFGPLWDGTMTETAVSQVDEITGG